MAIPLHELNTDGSVTLPTIANRSVLKTFTNVLRLNEDYGAIGQGAASATTDTAALNQAWSDALALKNAVIELTPGCIYQHNGTSTTLSNGTDAAQLVIPKTWGGSNSPVTYFNYCIGFVCFAGFATIQTTNTGIHNWLLAADSNYAAHVGQTSPPDTSTSNVLNGGFISHNVAYQVPQSTNSPHVVGCNGVNLAFMGLVHLDNFLVWTGSNGIPQPDTTNHPLPVGLILPAWQNYAYIRTDSIYAYGFNVGVWTSEHFHADYVNLGGNNYAWGVGGGAGQGKGHPAHVGILDTELNFQGNIIALRQYAPTGTPGAGSYERFIVDAMTVENANGAQDVIDPNNYLLGRVLGYNSVNPIQAPNAPNNVFSSIGRYVGEIDSVQALTSAASVNVYTTAGTIGTLTPAQDITFTFYDSPAGEEFILIITTSGTTSRAITFANALGQGVLNTGTVDGKHCVVRFKSLGHTTVGGFAWVEMSRTPIF